MTAQQWLSMTQPANTNTIGKAEEVVIGLSSAFAFFNGTNEIKFIIFRIVQGDGYALNSLTNLKEAKTNGVKDVCFSKGRGLEEDDMCRSKRLYKGLRKFRAEIESGISWLKRSLGLNRCTWKGF